MDDIKAAGEFIKWLCGVVPLWAWQILGCIAVTFMVMPFIKLLQPLEWEPRTRRTVNALITIPTGGAITLWLYDQPGKNFVIILVMFCNAGLYKGMTKLSERNRDTSKAWFLLYYWLRPFERYEFKDGVEKAVDIASDTTIIDTVENLNKTTLAKQAEDK